MKEDSVCKDFLHTAQDGKRYNTKFYNLDAIISVGYRVSSHQATQFRVWASSVLKEYLVKGFALDDERLKQGMAATVHRYCVREMEIYLAASSRPGRGKPTYDWRFVLEQLSSDGHVFGHDAKIVEVREKHYHITNKGRLFKEAKGYQGQRSSLRWKKAWIVISAIAIAANAIIIMVVTIFATIASLGDMEKDEHIIQLDKKNAALEQRITDLEHELQTLRLKAADTSPTPVTTQPEAAQSR